MVVILPDHIVEEILSRLPVKILLRLRCVCKAWLDTISDLSFVNLHLHRSVERDAIEFNLWNAGLMYCCDVKTPKHLAEITNPIRARGRNYWHFIGSCDGLIFFVSKNCKKISMMNPSTRKFEVVEQKKSLLVDSWFIYRHPISSEYKLLTVDYKSHSISEVMVYAFSNKTWEKVRDVPYTLCTKGIIFRGAMHWIANSQLFPVVLMFHLADDTFSEMTLFNENQNFSLDGDLTEWENNLCLVRAPKGKSIIVVWMMKEYGNKDSWTKLFVIDNLDIRLFTVSPLHMRLLGKMAFDICFGRKGDDDSRTGVFVYDEKNQLFEEIKVVRRKPRTGANKRVAGRWWLISHVDSLLNPQQIFRAIA